MFVCFYIQSCFLLCLSHLIDCHPCKSNADIGATTIDPDTLILTYDELLSLTSDGEESSTSELDLLRDYEEKYRKEGVPGGEYALLDSSASNDMVNNQTEFSKRTTSGFPNEEDHSDEVTTFFYEYFDFPEEMPKLEPTESTLEKNFADFFDSLGIPAISLPGSDGGGSIQGGKTTFENFGTGGTRGITSYSQDDGEIRKCPKTYRLKFYPKRQLYRCVRKRFKAKIRTSVSLESSNSTRSLHKTDHKDQTSEELRTTTEDPSLSEIFDF